MERSRNFVSRKIRVTPELMEKARKAFKEAERSGIRSEEGLTRRELRALERKGCVRKMVIFGDTKYSDQTGSRSYIWQWVEENERI